MFQVNSKSALRESSCAGHRSGVLCWLGGSRLSPAGLALLGLGFVAAFVVRLRGKQGLSSECIFAWNTIPAMHDTGLGVGDIKLLML